MLDSEGLRKAALIRLWDLGLGPYGQVPERRWQILYLHRFHPCDREVVRPLVSNLVAWWTRNMEGQRSDPTHWYAWKARCQQLVLQLQMMNLRPIAVQELDLKPRSYFDITAFKKAMNL